MSEAIVSFNEPDTLVLRYLDNPRADLKDMIMVQYAGLVERIARRFAGLETQEDLVQVGFIGLLNALSKFDPAAGVRFNTYATHLVAGEIKHYLRDRSQTIRQPAWLQELRHKVTKSSSVLQSRLGRTPTPEEIAVDLGVSASSVQEVFLTQDTLKLASLDSTLPGDEDGGSEVDNLDSGAFCPEQLSVEDRVVLEAAITQLRDLEREVLVLFHFDAMNQTEIAHKLGISCNYVSHILRQSLAKLRRILTTEEEKDRVLQKQSSTVDDNVLDPQTGIYNEDYFRSRLTEEMHRASGHGGVVALIMVNFEGIETLQGFYGEISVSDFLADTADFLKNSVRRLDILCRFGETGFGIILPSTGPSVNVVVQRLAAKFEPWLSSRRAPTGPITLMLGKAVFPDDCRTLEEFIAKATPACDKREASSPTMHQAKKRAA